MSGLPLSTLDVLELTHVIALTVLDDMRLVIEPQEIARDAEHNSATFRIVQQPALLDQYVCRAEVSTVQGTNHRLVIDGEFSLTNDIAVTGTGSLQLVYSDGEAVILKTYKVPFHVSASINAIDPSDPEYENGLAQITRAAFANAVGDDTGIQFFNVANQPLDFVAYPPGQGGGIDEATADLLYVRRDGANTMAADLRMVPAGNIDDPIGIVLGGRQARIQWNSGILLQKGLAGEDIYVANVDGSARSPVVTQVTGDQRYLREINANQLYCALDGTQMRGPFISQTGSSNTNLGVSVGDNSAGFWRTGLYLICVMGGQTVWQSSTTELLFGVRINAATQQITNVGAPTSAGDAANRGYVDAAIAAIPRPVVPASRAFIANEVTITATPVEFFNQPFFTNDNAARTILVTAYPQFSGGQPSSFYDLEYSTNLSAGLIERSTVYPTAQGYMGGGQAVCFAVTVTPVSSQIQVSLSVRMMAANPGPDLIQIGSRATQRSYVVIQEMTN